MAHHDVILCDAPSDAHTTLRVRCTVTWHAPGTRPDLARTAPMHSPLAIFFCGSCCWHSCDAAEHAHPTTCVLFYKPKWIRLQVAVARVSRGLLPQDFRTNMKPHNAVPEQHLCRHRVPSQEDQHVYRIFRFVTDGIEGDAHCLTNACDCRE